MLEVVRYQEKDEALWDRFVLKESANGTFLQTRNFLNYHPKGRFLDHSLLIWGKSNQLYAVVPACEAEIDGKRTLASHPGSTFGGLIINQAYFHRARYRARFLDAILEAFEAYWVSQDFACVRFTITPALFSKEDPALLEYLLKLHRYSELVSLSSYIDFEKFNDDVTSNYNAENRRLLRKMEGKGLEFRRLWEDDEVLAFYRLLCQNLKKYKTQPIHTPEQLLDFKNVRLRGIAQFYGVFLEGEMLAASLCFDFDHRVLHTQNLAADPYREKIEGINPMTYLCDQIIREAKRQAYRALSFGVSTEQGGRVLNFELLHAKEAYGSLYTLNRSYSKERSDASLKPLKEILYLIFQQKYCQFTQVMRKISKNHHKKYMTKHGIQNQFLVLVFYLERYNFLSKQTCTEAACTVLIPAFAVFAIRWDCAARKKVQGC